MPVNFVIAHRVGWYKRRFRSIKYQTLHKTCLYKTFLTTDYIFANIQACVCSILEIVVSYPHAFYDAHRVMLTYKPNKTEFRIFSNPYVHVKYHSMNQKFLLLFRSNAVRWLKYPRYDIKHLLIFQQSS